jgi:hypothetical protein
MDGNEVKGELLEVSKKPLELKGKPLSLGAKIVAVIIVLGAFIGLVFTSVDVSLIFGNIFGTRHVNDLSDNARQGGFRP